MMSASGAPSPGTPFVVPLYSAQSRQPPTRLAMIASFRCFSFASMHHTLAPRCAVGSAFYSDLQGPPVHACPHEPADNLAPSPIDRRSVEPTSDDGPEEGRSEVGPGETMGVAFAVHRV